MAVLSNTSVRAGASAAGGGDASQISKSLRFNDDDTAYLDKTPSGAGNKLTWTWSGWVKRCKLGADQTLFGAGSSSVLDSKIYFDSSDRLGCWNYTASAYKSNQLTTAKYKDPGAWYHIVVSCNGTTSLKIYVNNVEQALGTDTGPDGTDWYFNTASTAHNLGRHITAASYFDGLMADVHWIDGSALDPSSFGKTDSTTGQWVPIEYTGTYGTNGFYLKFDGTDLGEDSSGNDNDWDANYLTASLPSWTPGNWWYDDTLHTTKSDITSNATQLASNGGGGTVPSSNYTYFIPNGDESVGADCFNGDYSLNSTYKWWRYSGSAWVHTSGGGGYGNTDNPHEWGATPDSNSYKLGDHDFYLLSNYDSSPGQNWGTVPSVNTSYGDPLEVDVSTDTPTTFDDESRGTGNYCTFNPLDNSDLVLSQGNLKSTQGSPAWERVFGTIGIKTGKWYWEVTKHDAGHEDRNSIGFGITNSENPDHGSASAGSHYTMLSWAANHYDNGITRTYTAATQVPTAGGNEAQAGTWMIAMDLDNGKGWTGKDGTWFKVGGLGGNPATGADPCFYNFIDGATYVPMLTHFYASSITVNFGQRPFKHTPPSGFKAINTYNLPDPTITDPSKYFDTLLYTGDSSASERTVTGLGFEPDMIWVKNRVEARDHFLWDAVRGSDNNLQPSTTNEEGTLATNSRGVITGNASDGIKVKVGSLNGLNVNETDDTYVAWNWDAGSSNTSASVGSLNSSVYDTSEDWSANFANDAGNTTDVGQAFRGITDATGTGLGSSFLSLTDVAFDVTSTISVWAHDPGSIAVSIEYNGTTYTNSSPTRFGWTDFTVPSGSNSGTLKAKLASSSDEIRGVKIDGKILVDSNVTPPNVPTIASTYRANPDAGFSIVTYEGNATSGASIAHGLNAKPDFAIFKNRETAGYNWYVYHKNLGNTHHLYLNQAYADNDDSGAFNDTDPDSNVFTLGNTGDVSQDTKDMVAYMWSGVEGYSKFGTFTGNGSADGPFIYCGFRPRYILTKGEDANDWYIRDTARSPFNVVDNPLRQDSGDEYSGREVDILSNGFKLRTSDSQVNSNNTVYFYAAFAESPFKYSNAH